MKKSLRRWLWLGASVVVLGLIVFHLRRSPEWQNFRWDRLWFSLAHAQPGFLLAALAATLSSYFVRAYRWKIFLDPVKKASLRVLFVGQILGFSSIYLVGRPGELVRPAYIAWKEKVSMSSMAAVWLLERISDTVFLVLLFAAALYLVPANPTTPTAKSVVAAMHHGGGLMFVATPLLVAGLVFFRLRSEPLILRISNLFRFLAPRGRQHLERFLKSFAEALGVIRDLKGVMASVVSTIVLWIINASVFWFVFQSLGEGLEQLSWLAAVMVMFFAVLGLLGQLPVVGGGYQALAILALTEVYNVEVELATGAGFLVWIMISVPCIVLGLVLLAHEGLTFKKLEAIAEAERAAAAVIH